MTDIGWLLIAFGVLVVIGGVVAIWKLIPTWQCPECFSYRVEEENTSLSCRECGHEWVSR